MAGDVVFPRLWVDVSTVRAWQRTPHGIARVEAGLGQALARRHSTARAIWIERGRLLCGSHHDLLALSDGHDSTTAAFDHPALAPSWTDDWTSQAISSLGLASRQARLAGGAAIAVSGLPRSLGSPLTASISATRRWRRKQGTGHDAGVPPGIRPDDLVLVTGADWNTGVVETLLRARRQERPRAWVLMHDLLPVTHPELLCNDAATERFAEWTHAVAHLAERVLFVSEHTRSEFLGFMGESGLTPPETSVLPPAVSSPAGPTDPVAGVDPSQPYVVYVSTVERRKNHVVLVQAARAAADRNEPFPTIVFVGSWGWGTDDLRQELQRDRLLAGRVIHLSGMTDPQMTWLVDHATAVVFPSRFEGFGLPVAEARERGKPVIAADIPALREVLDQDAWFLDPHDAGAWRSALVAVAEGTLPPVGTAIRRTWDDVARELDELLTPPQAGAVAAAGPIG